MNKDFITAVALSVTLLGLCDLCFRVFKRKPKPTLFYATHVLTRDPEGSYEQPLVQLMGLCNKLGLEGKRITRVSTTPLPSRDSIRVHFQGETK